MTHFPAHMDKVEAEIINLAISGILEAGCMISVSDGEVYVLKRSRDRAAIQREVAATDETIFLVRTADGERVGVVYFIHGNGPDVLADHSANDSMESMLKAANEYAQSF